MKTEILNSAQASAHSSLYSLDTTNRETDYAYDQGFHLITIPQGSKKPIEDDWSTKRYPRETIKDRVNKSQANIGVLLGEASNGLIDIDLDCDEAIRLAQHFLPPTRTYGQ
jgi:hypothetical protein